MGERMILFLFFLGVGWGQWYLIGTFSKHFKLYVTIFKDLGMEAQLTSVLLAYVHGFQHYHMYLWREENTHLLNPFIILICQTLADMNRLIKTVIIE